MPTFTSRTTAFCSRLCLTAMLFASAAATAAPAAVHEELFDFKTFSFARLTLTDGNRPPLRYYLSTPAQKAPLVLYIQGSGCVPPFVGLGTPNRSSTIYSWIPLAAERRYAVMVVDKPYQSDEPQQGDPGSAVGCAGDFNRHFSYDTWLATLKQALRHALRRPEVDAQRVLVIGISEGGTMAAGLARELAEVTDVALIGANGPTQLYDFAANIYRSNGSDEDKFERLQALDRTYGAIAADPASTSKFAWGHPYLRWSSFFAQSTAENLAHSKARVYLASGMQDDSVPILSTEVLYAQLRTQGRDVTFRRIPSAGHNLAPPGRPASDAQQEYASLAGVVCAALTAQACWPDRAGWRRGGRMGGN